MSFALLAALLRYHEELSDSILLNRQWQGNAILFYQHFSLFSLFLRCFILFYEISLFSPVAELLAGCYAAEIFVIVLTLSAEEEESVGTFPPRSSRFFMS